MSSLQLLAVTLGEIGFVVLGLIVLLTAPSHSARPTRSSCSHSSLPVDPDSSTTVADVRVTGRVPFRQPLRQLGQAAAPVFPETVNRQTKFHVDVMPEGSSAHNTSALPLDNPNARLQLCTAPPPPVVFPDQPDVEAHNSSDRPDEEMIDIWLEVTEAPVEDTCHVVQHAPAAGMISATPQGSTVLLTVITLATAQGLSQTDAAIARLGEQLDHLAITPHPSSRRFPATASQSDPAVAEVGEQLNAASTAKQSLTALPALQFDAAIAELGEQLKDVSIAPKQESQQTTPVVLQPAPVVPPSPAPSCSKFLFEPLSEFIKGFRSETKMAAPSRSKSPGLNLPPHGILKGPRSKTNVPLGKRVVAAIGSGSPDINTLTAAFEGLSTGRQRDKRLMFPHLFDGSDSTYAADGRTITNEDLKIVVRVAGKALVKAIRSYSSCQQALAKAKANFEQLFVRILNDDIDEEIFRSAYSMVKAVIKIVELTFSSSLGIFRDQMIKKHGFDVKLLNRDATFAGVCSGFCAN
ncbi:hypothetical protein OQA88_10471 [Cercophora sp. LCS_1]